MLERIIFLLFTEAYHENVFVEWIERILHDSNGMSGHIGMPGLNKLYIEIV